jgi:hypothetical protein
MRSIFALAPLLLLPGTVLAQSGGDHKEAMIRSARSAAVASVADNATIIDHAGNVLHPGTNGWVCMPDMPDVPNNSPMCLDKPWLEVIDAWMNKRAPKFQGIGIGYMLQGDMPVSNTDPFATAPTPDNQWVANSGPHIMMVVSDQGLLESLPTNSKNGGPWVMWKGTPYAHIMIPTVPHAP